MYFPIKREIKYQEENCYFLEQFGNLDLVYDQNNDEKAVVFVG